MRMDKLTSRFQQALADAIGIARPSLSAIESGKAYPSPDTFEALMYELDLDLPEILVKDASYQGIPVAHEDPLADHRLGFGRALRRGRRLEGLRLWQVAKLCGLSKAQLSRLERGEVRISSAYEDHPDDTALPKKSRMIRFRHPELQRLYALG